MSSAISVHYNVVNNDQGGFSVIEIPFEKVKLSDGLKPEDSLKIGLVIFNTHFSEVWETRFVILKGKNEWFQCPELSADPLEDSEDIINQFTTEIELAEKCPAKFVLNFNLLGIFDLVNYGAGYEEKLSREWRAYFIANNFNFKASLKSASFMGKEQFVVKIKVKSLSDGSSENYSFVYDPAFEGNADMITETNFVIASYLTSAS